MNKLIRDLFYAAALGWLLGKGGDAGAVFAPRP